jgi:O-antigen ligase
MPASGTLAAPHAAPSTTLAERFLHGALVLTILLSPFVLVEPSPYELGFAVLALAFVAARVPVDRGVAPLALLLFLWNLSGAVALVPVLHDRDAVFFTLISIYLAVTAVLFACLFAEHSMRRLELVRSAYIIAAVIAAMIGILAYFHVLPGSDRFLLGAIRAKSTFKDPNVFGPFLVLPLLLLIDRAMRERVRFVELLAALVILLGLLLSFSRGAWANFLLSAAVLMVLLLLTSPTPRLRARVIGSGIMAVAAVLVLLAIALSFDVIDQAFRERANFLNPYDAGPGGRFGRQMEGILGLLESPFGVGPLQFANHWAQDPHNVYLNAIASYGWPGAVAYLLLILSTLWVGFRALLASTPWQPYLVAAFAAFVGTVGEGVVIDTDHWRHFFLMLGIIWGLAIATNRAVAGRSAPVAVSQPRNLERDRQRPAVFRL